MISRIWRGWTTIENADTYEELLREEVFVGIKSRNIPGFRSIQLLRRTLEAEVEFVTIMHFDSIAAVREFAGDDYEAAVVPSAARAVLSHFDAKSLHYELKNLISDPGSPNGTGPGWPAVALALVGCVAAAFVLQNLGVAPAMKAMQGR